MDMLYDSSNNSIIVTSRRYPAETWKLTEHKEHEHEVINT